MQLGIDDPWTC